MERAGIVTAGGKPVTLVGPELKAGDKAPGFTVLDQELKEVALEDFAGKVKLISVTPSLDTSVCELQLRRFNQEAASLGESTVVLNISMDLPFAIKRFCVAQGIEGAVALSDHMNANFGRAYGVLIKELRLLARSVFIIDPSDMIRYVQIVQEMTDHPDYDDALAALKSL